MLNQLFPQHVDNTYRGYKLALWLFVLVLFMKLGMSMGSIFNGYSVASSADGIPLATFSPGAAATVVSLFALLGLSHFLFGLLGIVALVRYRNMVPFVFALFLLEYLGRRLILQFLPIPRTGTSTGLYVNLALLAVMIAGLALSLRSPDNRVRA